MYETNPGIIRVEITDTKEITADHAYLYVSVRGSSLVTGNVALQKAKEVAQLVSELITVGLSQEDIRIQNIHAEQSSGFLGKSSSAIYRLKIHCPRLELLADLLGVITSQKNATFQYIQWGYPENIDSLDRILSECIGRTNAKVGRIAASLGVTVLGIQHFSDTLDDPEHPVRNDMAFAMAPGAGMNPMKSSVPLGLEVSHSKTVTLHVTVEYRISDFAAKQEVNSDR